MTCKPILGYASRTEAAQALIAQGLSRRAIASHFGCSPNTISSLLACAQKRIYRPNGDAPNRTVLIPTDVLAALAPHALKRGLHANALARLIVETVAEEGMVDAVLDDGGGK